MSWVDRERDEEGIAQIYLLNYFSHISEVHLSSRNGNLGGARSLIGDFK
jgi:hypothetical protein